MEKRRNEGVPIKFFRKYAQYFFEKSLSRRKNLSVRGCRVWSYNCGNFFGSIFSSDDVSDPINDNEELSTLSVSPPVITKKPVTSKDAVPAPILKKEKGKKSTDTSGKKIDKKKTDSTATQKKEPAKKQSQKEEDFNWLFNWFSLERIAIIVLLIFIIAYMHMSNKKRKTEIAKAVADALQKERTSSSGTV